MKAFEKWPEFMRAGSQPSARRVAREEEGELELDTSAEVRPRRKPQSRRSLRAQTQAASSGGGRRFLSMFLACATVGVLGVGVFYGYLWYTGGKGHIPLIQAMDDPVKVKPENPGGMEVPYQDRLVLNQPESGDAANASVERLLPPPETPKPVVDTTAAAQAPASNNAQPEVASVVVPSSDQQAQSTVANGAAHQPAEEPEAETTVAVKPTAPKEEKTAAKAPSGAKSETKVQIALPAEPAEGSYLLQLGSFNSRKVGKGAWDDFQRKYPDLLVGMVLYLQQAEVNGKTYHRVQAGPFPNRATAIDLCAELKSRNQDCLVVKR